MCTFFNSNIQTTLYLYDPFIKPVALYASDFWWCLKLPKNNSVDNFHHMTCKCILFVRTQAIMVGVPLELVRVPLQLYAIKAEIKNLGRYDVFLPYHRKPPFIHQKLFNKLSYIFHQELFQNINDEQGKQRTYRLLKHKIGIENY